MHKLHEYVFALIILHCLTQWVDCTCDVRPASIRAPHGCYNYGLCTKPYMQLVSRSPKVYRWACTTPNDCVCVNGTSKGTYACSTIDDQCGNSPCGTDPNQHFVCTSDIGSYTCTCAAGYTGTNCDFSTNGGCAAAMDPCINGGTCHDTSDGGFSCSCPDGFSGERCQYYDFCGKNTTCQNSGECENLFNGTNFICKCTEQNTQGRYCESTEVGLDNNPCNDNPTLCGISPSQGACVNLPYTTVIDTTSGYLCICAPEYTGPNCEQSMADPCASMPCQNNATCIPDTVLHTYTCDCSIGYYGDDCQFVKKCNTSTCLNGGTCIENDNGTTSCECLMYYHGNRCEVVDRCEYGNPCYNGTCNSTPNCTDPTAYTCTCNPGYTGVNCENETNECIPNNCQNFATCIDLFMDYECTCLDGTSGKNCEINEDDCKGVEYHGAAKSSPCNTKDDQAVCTDQIGGYVCTCSEQWVGEKCDMNVIIRDVLLAIYGEINMEMVPMLEDLMKQPVLIKDMVPYILGMKTYEERLNLSWTADDLFDWIAYEEKELDPHLDLYMSNDIVLGNCFTFNKNLNVNYSYNVRDGGTNNGLRAKIRMRQDEYVPWTDTAAILAFVASGTDYIFAESVRYNAEPGGVTIFDVADTRYQRLGGKYGTCIKESKEVPYYYYPGTYSADDTHSRKAEFLVLLQKVVVFDLHKNLFDFLGPAVEKAAAKNGDPSTWDWCFCPSVCSNQLYQVAWTRTGYGQFPPECPDHDNISCVIEEMDTVHIITRMIPLEYSLFEETPAMDFNKFISNLGGLLGVLMGISIISFIEFFFLIVRLVSIIVSGKNI